LFLTFEGKSLTGLNTTFIAGSQFARLTGCRRLPLISWLNQVEIWLSILAGQSLSAASFGGVRELTAHINHFIKSYNEHATPFIRTKCIVHQKQLKPGFAVQ
jgi:hypothetical protein